MRFFFSFFVTSSGWPVKNLSRPDIWMLLIHGQYLCLGAIVQYSVFSAKIYFLMIHTIYLRDHFEKFGHFWRRFSQIEALRRCFDRECFDQLVTFAPPRPTCYRKQVTSDQHALCTSRHAPTSQSPSQTWSPYLPSQVDATLGAAYPDDASPGHNTESSIKGTPENKTDQLHIQSHAMWLWCCCKVQRYVHVGEMEGWVPVKRRVNTRGPLAGDCNSNKRAVRAKRGASVCPKYRR